jgi:cell division protein FtsB
VAPAASQKKCVCNKRHCAVAFYCCVYEQYLAEGEGSACEEQIKELKRKRKEIDKQIKEEKARTKEIKELSEYVGTDEYVEDVAKEKLGLIHEDEIIFKAE